MWDVEFEVQLEVKMSPSEPLEVKDVFGMVTVVLVLVMGLTIDSRVVYDNVSVRFYFLFWFACIYLLVLEQEYVNVKIPATNPFNSLLQRWSSPSSSTPNTTQRMSTPRYRISPKAKKATEGN
jgi:hypothetical protein